MASKVMTNNAAAGGAVTQALSDAEIVAQFKQRGCWGLYTSVDLKVCDLIDMKRFGEPQIIHFGPNERVAGFSMTQLIETSLVSGHFANETNAAYLDIFSCKEYEPSKAAEFCKDFFGAQSVTYQVLFRD